MFNVLCLQERYGLILGGQATWVGDDQLLSTDGLLARAPVIENPSLFCL
jgi:hypothetical protein